LLYAVDGAGVGVAAGFLGEGRACNATVGGVGGNTTLAGLGAVATLESACGPRVERRHNAINGAVLVFASLRFDERGAFSAASRGLTLDMSDTLLVAATAGNIA
jgi:hypothetical protein